MRIQINLGVLYETLTILNKFGAEIESEIDFDLKNSPAS